MGRWLGKDCMCNAVCHDHEVRANILPAMSTSAGSAARRGDSPPQAARSKRSGRSLTRSRRQEPASQFPGQASASGAPPCIRQPHLYPDLPPSPTETRVGAAMDDRRPIYNNPELIRSVAKSMKKIKVALEDYTEECASWNADLWQADQSGQSGVEATAGSSTNIIKRESVYLTVRQHFDGFLEDLNQF